jgi:hypothetical protein
MRLKYYVRDYVRDSAINKILSHFGMTNSLTIYNLVTTSPLEIVVQVLSAKFGLSKAIVMLIIVFLL